MKRRAIPILFIVLGMWLLSGCFTIPTFEHAATSGAKDFRDYLGDSKSKRPIRTGAITREKIIALLGEPSLIRPGTTSIGYDYIAVRSVTVYPLCFFMSEPSSERRYVIRFDFDPENVLTGWQNAADDSQPWPMAIFDHSLAFPAVPFDLKYTAMPRYRIYESPAATQPAP